MSHIADVKFCFNRGLNRFENLTISLHNIISFITIIGYASFGHLFYLLNHCKDEVAVFFLQVNAQTVQEFDSRAYFSDNLGKNMVIP